MTSLICYDLKQLIDSSNKYRYLCIINLNDVAEHVCNL